MSGGGLVFRPPVATAGFINDCSLLIQMLNADCPAEYEDWIFDAAHIASVMPPTCTKPHVI